VLSYKTQRNPVEPDGRPMRLFLGAEIVCLRELKTEAAERDALIKRVIAYVQDKLAIENKKNQLERALGVKLGEMDDVLRYFMLGDYLSSVHGTETTLIQIQQRFRVLERVMAILNDCDGAHPGAAFDFCIAYPQHGPAEFIDFQHRCGMVFYNERERILSHLSREDREKLKNLSLKDVLEPSRVTTMDEICNWSPDHSRSSERAYKLIIGNRFMRPSRIKYYNLELRNLNSGTRPCQSL